ncbi:sugar kinase, partial [Thioclava sp. BHET1]
MDVLMVGEPLAEFTSDAASPDMFQRRLGGDTLNAAIYLARLRPDLKIGYLTRLGDDWMSLWMREAIAAEGVDVSAVTLEKSAAPGLSFIRTEARGERSFIYWRGQTPARRMFSGAAAAAEGAALSAAGCVLFSGIVLAILPDAARAALIDALTRHRAAGGTVAYDTNYRSRLWSRDEAAYWTRHALAAASIALPSTEDVEAIFGVKGPAAAMDLCCAHATGEVVLTDGGAAVHCR